MYGLTNLPTGHTITTSYPLQPAARAYAKSGVVSTPFYEGLMAESLGGCLEAATYSTGDVTGAPASRRTLAVPPRRAPEVVLRWLDPSADQPSQRLLRMYFDGARADSVVVYIESGGFIHLRPLDCGG